MKRSFFLVMVAVLVMTVGCKKNLLPDNTNRDTFIGKWYVESNGTLQYSDDSTKTIPLVMVDTMVITAAQADGYCHVKCGKLDADAKVTDKGLEIPDFVKEDSVSGIAYEYSYNLTITNDPATVTLGVLSWKSSVKGTVSGGTIGIGLTYSASGSLTSRGIKK